MDSVLCTRASISIAQSAYGPTRGGAAGQRVPDLGARALVTAARMRARA
jgi:hypothetical protein